MLEPSTIDICRPMKQFICTLFASAALSLSVFSQEAASGPSQVYETFYGTRLINLHTTEQVGRKVLAYRISHRMGSMRGGALYNFLGLDGPASISFIFDYGLSNKLGVGIARDQAGKMYSGYAKYTLLNQMKGGGSPVNLVLYGKANISTLRDDAAQANGYSRFDNFGHRFSYVTQLLISRKFGERFSAQLSPTYIHHNLVETAADKNDIFALGFGAVYKLSKRFGLSGEYNLVLNNHTQGVTYNSAGLGFDIVTGGHIFQIHLINSTTINEALVIPYTNSDWLNGDFRIGFNISRSFWR